MLSVEVSWEPGAEQWMGMLEKTESSPGDGSWAVEVPLQGHRVCWGPGPLLQVSQQISKCRWQSGG